MYEKPGIIISKTPSGFRINEDKGAISIDEEYRLLFCEPQYYFVKTHVFKSIATMRSILNTKKIEGLCQQDVYEKFADYVLEDHQGKHEDYGENLDVKTVKPLLLEAMIGMHFE